MVLFLLDIFTLIKRSFGKAFHYYKKVDLEKSLLDFEEPDTNFHQLLLLRSTFYNIWQL